MCLGGSYLHLFYAEGLVCFPGDGCFAFNNLGDREGRVREEREKGEFGVEDGRKGDRKREYYGGKLKSMLIP